jgi:signal transduction histidine kinase
LLLPGFLLPGCRWLFPDYLPYTFQDTYSGSYDPTTETYGFADVDGDGRFEFWNYAYNSGTFEQYPNSFSLYDENMAALLWQDNNERRYCSILPVFYRYEAKTGQLQYPQGLLISQKGPLKACFTLMDARTQDIHWSREIYQGKDFDGNGDWDGAFDLNQSIDLNGDGREEVLVRACAAFDRYPRGLWALELTHGDILWKYPTGCPVNVLLVTDLNSDGKEEIVLDTSAPCNGAVAGSTDDSHSYLIILDAATGSELYCREMGSASSNVQNVAVDRKGEGTFIATVSGANAAGAGFSRLRFWKGCPPVEVDSFDLGPNLCKLKAFDADGDGKQEAVTTEGHEVKVFTPHHSPKTLTMPFQILDAKIVQLPNPVNREVLLLQSDSCLVGLGNNFKPLFNINGGYLLYPLESPRLAVLTKSEVALGSLVRTPLPIPWREMGFFGAGVAAVLLIVSTVMAFRIPFQWRRLERELPCGVIWMSPKGKVRKANMTAKGLFPDLIHKPPEEILTAVQRLRRGRLEWHDLSLTRGSGQREQTLQARLRAYSHGVLVLVWDRTDAQRSKFLRTWAEGIGRIVHFFKSPATTIQMGVQQMKKSGPKPETLELLEGQSELLIRYAARFKKIITMLEPKPEPIELNQLIRRVLLPYMASQPATLEIEFSVEDDKLEVKADRDQMEIMLRCLVDNAVEALESNGQIKVRTRRLEAVQREGQDIVQQFAEIEITDNGPGLSALAIEQSLKAGFTTKPNGMGLGLPQSKLIAELHGGEFEISSQPGVGTTISIKLPLLES